MPRGGGPRPGAGKKPRQFNVLTRKAREEAQRTGVLPHEWLLSVSRGEAVTHMRLKIEYHKSGPNKGEEKSREWVEEIIYADFPTRLDAAKAAAPYYAPKLATQTINVGAKNADAVVDALRTLADQLPV